jgi:SAM-dependent methyltransferase
MPEAEVPARYDSLAEGYARHWGPVIRPAAEAVLDHLDGALPAAPRILDVGTGTGTLALRALEQWPGAQVTGVDASDAMLALAAEAAAARLPAHLVGRFRRHTAVADRLPFEDASFDAAVSSFVLQLVPSRAAALREIRRVLRPGGRVAWVTWLAGGQRFPGDEVVDDVLDELGFDPPERNERSGDPASVGAAAEATRRAGFRSVHAEAAVLAHRWRPEGYAAFITDFDEQTTFESLDPGERRRAEERLLARLRELDADDLTMRLPIVYVIGVAR